jgi:ubiquinone/menaquinone biosynthesis C-methylase UbiE
MTNFQCISCSSAFDDSHLGKYACPKCGEKYELAAGYIKTYFDKALYDAFRKDYLLNKILNNNGYISYHHLPEASISLSDRKDVINFRRFIERNLHGKNILDVGCGLMEMPGYLELEKHSEVELIGLDPIDDHNFNGLRIVGCSEFVPLPDETIDTIVFATSMDHVCNLSKTIAETLRLLRNHGHVLIWMSDRSLSIQSRVKKWIRQQLNSWKLGYPVHKYYVYDNWTVLGVPSGGVDPFHSYHESPKKIIRLFSKKGFQLLTQEVYSRDEVFLCFKKALN